MAIVVIRCVSCDRFLGRVKLVEGGRHEVFCRESQCKCLTCLELRAGAVTISRAEKYASPLSQLHVASRD